MSSYSLLHKGNRFSFTLQEDRTDATSHMCSMVDSIKSHKEDRTDATSLMCSMVDSIKSHPVMVCGCFLAFEVSHNLCL